MPSKLLLDEHVPLAVAEGLRRSGVDTVHVVETELRSSPDDMVLAAATEMERVIVTYNVRDFSALAGLWADERRTHAGILLVPGQPSVGELLRRLHAVLEMSPPPDLRNTIRFV